MSSDPILGVVPLGFQWPTLDPFLFCVHHDDAYPAGNEALGPQASLAGRNLGQDFEGKDGWRMYHGDVVPGFPQHPHRGFETVTIVRRGLIDHSDSLGARARFGQGDVQWLTAGRGIVHSEMFPLLDRVAANPLELFQIWLNLPRAHKMVDPHFSMLWSRALGRRTFTDAADKRADVTLIAGRLGELDAPAPPPKSWAASADSDVAIWTIRLDPGATWTLPAAHADSNRVLYFFKGRELSVGGQKVSGRSGVQLAGDAELELRNSEVEGELLLLQGKPISEPVVQYGPFVMNTKDEIQQAFDDYQRTRFGGWPWPSDGPVHGTESARFAEHADRRRETAD